MLSLTKKEALMIKRRRLGKTQKEFAEEYGVSLSTYSVWEHTDVKTAPFVKIRNLQPHEYCLLCRKRLGYTQRQVAKEIGISRYWLNQMEIGHRPCDNLLKYWKNNDNNAE